MAEYIVTLEEVGDGKFKLSGLPEIPTTAQAASVTQTPASSFAPPTGQDDWSDAQDASKEAMARYNAGQGQQGVYFNDAVNMFRVAGHNTVSPAPNWVFETPVPVQPEGAEADRDRKALKQLERDKEAQRNAGDQGAGGRFRP